MCKYIVANSASSVAIAGRFIISNLAAWIEIDLHVRQLQLSFLFDKKNTLTNLPAYFLAKAASTRLVPRSAAESIVPVAGTPILDSSIHATMKICRLLYLY